MKISELIPAEAIIPDMDAMDKGDAIKELVSALAEGGAIKRNQRAQVLEALMKREELGSTGIGKGIAVPHARNVSVKSSIGAFGRSSRGIEFGSIDGQPVHLLFLLVSPPDEAEEHIRALKKISLLAKDDDMCRFLERAAGCEEIAQLLAEADDRLGGAGSTRQPGGAQR